MYFDFFKVGEIDKELQLPIHRSDQRYFPLFRDTKQEPWAIISNVQTQYGSKVITLHGVLTVCYFIVLEFALYGSLRCIRFRFSIVLS